MIELAIQVFPDGSSYYVHFTIALPLPLLFPYIWREKNISGFMLYWISLVNRLLTT